MSDVQQSYKTRCGHCERIVSMAANYCKWCGTKQ